MKKERLFIDHWWLNIKIYCMFDGIFIFVHSFWDRLPSLSCPAFLCIEYFLLFFLHYYCDKFKIFTKKIVLDAFFYMF